MILSPPLWSGGTGVYGMAAPPSRRAVGALAAEPAEAAGGRCTARVDGGGGGGSDGELVISFSSPPSLPLGVATPDTVMAGLRLNDPSFESCFSTASAQLLLSLCPSNTTRPS